MLVTEQILPIFEPQEMSRKQYAGLQPPNLFYSVVNFPKQDPADNEVGRIRLFTDQVPHGKSLPIFLTGDFNSEPNQEVRTFWNYYPPVVVHIEP